MKLIKADPDRRIEIPGVAEPVWRPVDIDRSRTGFSHLRSLRIYRFDAGAIIDGHAEEDEVFIVVAAGSVEFAANDAPPKGEPSVHQLSAPGNLQHAFCAAYLPPHASYRLTAKTDAVVAYARATPPSGNPPKAFEVSEPLANKQVTTLLEERTYAQRLRVRLFQVNAKRSAVDLSPISEPEMDCETLVHIQVADGGGTSVVTPAGGTAIPIESWDTLAVLPGDRPTLHFAPQASALVLVISAT